MLRSISALGLQRNANTVACRKSDVGYRARVLPE